jgi:predicted nucleic acid-binding protein
MRFEEGEETAWTSTLALSQVFAHLRKRRKHHEIEKLYDYLEGSSMGITETTRTDIERARELKHDFNLSWSMWDDLVLAAQMERLGVREIYSNDNDLDKIVTVRRIFEH